MCSDWFLFAAPCRYICSSLFVLSHLFSVDTSARVLDSNIVETDAVAVVIEFNESEWGHGETQPERCRDWFWGFLFFLQFAVVFVLAIMGIQSMAKE